MLSTIPEGTFNLLFLGTGVSTSIPNLAHVVFCSNVRKSGDKDTSQVHNVLSTGKKNDEKNFKGPCRVCQDAFFNLDGKNRRNNVSVAIIYNETTTNNSCSSNESTLTDSEDTISSKQRVVVIDVGKTARDAFLRMFPRFGLQTIDSIM